MRLMGRNGICPRCQPCRPYVRLARLATSHGQIGRGFACQVALFCILNALCAAPCATAHGPQYYEARCSRWSRSSPLHNNDQRKLAMSRSGAVTFKGTPLTLAGEAVKVGPAGPRFHAALLRRRPEDDQAGRPQGQADVHQRRPLARHARLPDADQEVQRAARGPGRQGSTPSRSASICRSR